MSFVLLTPDLVEAIHDAVLNPGELPGRTRDTSLDGALARVDNRLAYGMIEDLFDLSAAPAVVIARGDCFNDANTRTAHQAMDLCRDLNGVQIDWSLHPVGDTIIRAAPGALDEGALDEGGLDDWLRARAT